MANDLQCVELLEMCEATGLQLVDSVEAEVTAKQQNTVTSHDGYCGDGNNNVLTACSCSEHPIVITPMKPVGESLIEGNKV